MFYNDGVNIGKHKRFDQKLFDIFDVPAREKIKKLFPEYVEDNSDPYGQDLLLKIPECKYNFLEIQVCANWETEKYPHKTLFVYERKNKYCDKTLFLTMNRFLTRGYLFDTKSFKDSKPRRLKKYSREYVYDIPWYKACYVDIDCLDKETFQLF